MSVTSASRLCGGDPDGDPGPPGGAVEGALRLHRATPLSEHLEIETYTLDVLPAELKSGGVVEYVSREIEFVRRALSDHPARASDLQ